MREDSTPIREQQVREAMSELELYLSDSIAPLLAADSLALLTRCPPRLVAMQCESWTREQFQAHGGSVRISNLFFHAFKKIHVVAELGLIAKEQLEPFLESLRGLLVEACPEGERETLRQNLELVGASGGPVTRKVDLLFAGGDQQVVPGPVVRAAGTVESGPGTAPSSGTQPAVATGSGAAAASTVDASHQLRQFTILLERLSAQATAGIASTAATSDLQRQLIAAAVESATSEKDLREHLAQVSATSHQKLDVTAAIRELSLDLPDWALRGDSGTPQYQGATAAAIDKIVAFTDDAEEAAGRFWELISSAAEQINKGAVARAVTLLDLAEKLATGPKLDQRRLRASRRSAAGALDDDALRELAGRTEVRRDFRRILNFFPEWTPTGILDQLDGETQRSRRHLLLSLLEVHGEEARELCLDRLEESLANAAHDAWMWQRNLIHVLRRVPVPAHDAREFLALDQTSDLGQSPQLVRESVTALAATHDDAATPILVDRLQTLLAGRQSGTWAGDEGLKLRTELALALAQLNTDHSRGWLVSLALEQQAGLMNLDLLEPLAECDLTPNPDLVETLFETLRSLLPVKVLGVSLPASVATLRNRQGTVHIARSLAGTRNGAVAQRLEDLASEFAGSDLAGVASRTAEIIRRNLASPPASLPSDAAQRSLSDTAAARLPKPEAPTGTTPVKGAPPIAGEVVFEGDLDVFRLPDLLQSLSQLGIDGRLELLDARERRVARIGVREGRVVEAAAGRLKGPEAVYEILEAPFPGSFHFVRHSDWAAEAESFDVMGLMMEGMRRFDEYKRMSALVPDAAVLHVTGTKPTPLSTADSTIVRPIWQGVRSGRTARQIERSVPVDRFRVRSLLAHWVEEGALSVPQ